MKKGIIILVITLLAASTFVAAGPLSDLFKAFGFGPTGMQTGILGNSLTDDSGSSASDEDATDESGASTTSGTTSDEDMTEDEKTEAEKAEEGSASSIGSSGRAIASKFSNIKPVGAAPLAERVAKLERKVMELERKLAECGCDKIKPKPCEEKCKKSYPAGGEKYKVCVKRCSEPEPTSNCIVDCKRKFSGENYNLDELKKCTSECERPSSLTLNKPLIGTSGDGDCKNRCEKDRRNCKDKITREYYDSCKRTTVGKPKEFMKCIQESKTQMEKEVDEKCSIDECLKKCEEGLASPSLGEMDATYETGEGKGKNEGADLTQLSPASDSYDEPDSGQGESEKKRGFFASIFG